MSQYHRVSKRKRSSPIPLDGRRHSARISQRPNRFADMNFKKGSGTLGEKNGREFDQFERNKGDGKYVAKKLCQEEREDALLDATPGSDDEQEIANEINDIVQDETFIDTSVEEDDPASESEDDEESSWNFSEEDTDSDA